MLLAEDLLLLLTDDESGKLAVDGTTADLALAGALLLELAMAGAVDVSEEEKASKARLRPGGEPVPGDPVLAEAHRTVAERFGKRPDSVIRPLGKGLRPRLYARLVGQGLVREESGKVLGLFPTRSWPAESAAHEREVRDALVGVLVQGVTPQPRTAALVSLLHAVRSVHKVVPHKDHGLSKRELDRRAKAVADGQWASAAVRRAVDAMNAATMSAITAAGAAAATGSS